MVPAVPVDDNSSHSFCLLLSLRMRVCFSPLFSAVPSRQPVCFVCEGRIVLYARQLRDLAIAQ